MPALIARCIYKNTVETRGCFTHYEYYVSSSRTFSFLKLKHIIKHGVLTDHSTRTRTFYCTFCYIGKSETYKETKKGKFHHILLYSYGVQVAMRCLICPVYSYRINGSFHGAERIILRYMQGVSWYIQLPYEYMYCLVTRYTDHSTSFYRTEQYILQSWSSGPTYDAADMLSASFADAFVTSVYEAPDRRPCVTAGLLPPKPPISGVLVNSIPLARVGVSHLSTVEIGRIEPGSCHRSLFVIDSLLGFEPKR